MKTKRSKSNEGIAKETRGKVAAKGEGGGRYIYSYWGSRAAGKGRGQGGGGVQSRPSEGEGWQTSPC